MPTVTVEDAQARLPELLDTHAFLWFILPEPVVLDGPGFRRFAGGAYFTPVTAPLATALPAPR
jgi:hypothetical protein